MPPTQQQQIDALRVAVEAMQYRLDAADQVREDTHRRVAEMQAQVDAMRVQLDALCAALMQPQIGHGGRSLIERLADRDATFEAIERGARGIKWLAALIIAIGVLVAAFRFGGLPKE